MKENGAFSVYLVDDDKIFLKSLEHYLQQKMKSSVRIKAFDTGEACLEEMKKEKPNIVVLDYLLNGTHAYAMDGLSVLQKIKETEPSTEVIMLSGREETEPAIDTMKYGAYDYITKTGNAYYKTLNAIKNAVQTMTLTRQNRHYKMLVGFTFFLIALFFTAAMILILSK